ncbi:hypothetical protein EV702DRAFT_1043675 [Suillus placidus]|uniref:Helitron helicase-like domain-containing protein n=1 Tax=Suillus placidus TaxID=48579 RepID=A0A9P7D4C5_9AGAM|nr:hypothetical protein EV702DRAFT_1043675 [Suillus placidus]
MLLYDQAVENKDDGQYGRLCRSCLDEVNANKTPVLALANNLWVGDVNSAVASIDDNQVFAHALANTAERYTVQRGNTFVNEYPRQDDDQSLSIGDAENPNHLLGAFPCLFPYAAGGFEVQRCRAVPYEIHAQWAMHYTDCRFRKDIHFMFEVFGVIQKRQVKKQDFHRSEQLFRSLAVEDLRKASEEEQKHQHVSNPTVRALKRHLTAVRSKVMGMDKSRTKIWSLIWGMCILKNPLSLWITINPTDTHDPIAQVFTGTEIDLNTFDRDSGPDSHSQSIRIAEDPYAAAKFFHFMITAILEELFAIKEDHFKYNHRPGIFGTIEAYVGTIEAQEMKELLQSDVFRAKVASFIARNIQGHHSEISKHHLQPNAWIDSEGHWGPKRTIGAMNNWNPVILLATRANHDTKLITNGEETKDIGFYISMYAAKNQQHSSNASALLTKSFAFHQTQEKHNSDAQALNKLLIQRCANSLSREQEFSAPEVVTYLMKWGNRYISHHFEAIYFSSVINLLKKTWPHLVFQQPVAELSSEGELQTQKNTAEAYDEEYAVLQFEEQTQSLQLRDQIREYMDRADALEDFSYMDYFLNTPNHETMPYFPGPWLPRHNTEHTYPLYCASMLALLKPWRTLLDLKLPLQTFSDAFDAFVAKASPNISKVLDNIQYFYDCSDKARENQINSAFGTAWNTASGSHDEEIDADEDSEEQGPVSDVTEENSQQAVTEEDIENAMQDCYLTCKLLYADVAINIAEDFAIFDDVPLQTVPCHPSRVTSEEEVQRYTEWHETFQLAQTAIPAINASDWRRRDRQVKAFECHHRDLFRTWM